MTTSKRLACNHRQIVCSNSSENFVKSFRELTELTELTEENSEVLDETWSTPIMGDETNTESVRLVLHLRYRYCIFYVRLKVSKQDKFFFFRPRSAFSNAGPDIMHLGRVDKVEKCN